MICYESPNGLHVQASDETLEELGASVDANMCVWCLGYDVVPDPEVVINYCKHGHYEERDTLECVNEAQDGDTDTDL